MGYCQGTAIQTRQIWFLQDLSVVSYALIDPVTLTLNISLLDPSRIQVDAAELRILICDRLHLLCFPIWFSTSYLDKP